MTSVIRPAQLGDIPLAVARPVASALLDTGECRCSHKAKAFLEYLHHHEVIDECPDRRNTTYQLTYDGDFTLREMMCNCYGDNWHINPEESRQIQRELFLQMVLVSPLPDTTHERVAQAIWAQHSKDRKADNTYIPAQLNTHRNDILRLRTHAPMRIHGAGWVIDTEADMQRFGEIILNEHVISNIQQIESHDQLPVMTIENIGAWDSCPLINNLLTIFTPGHDTRLTIRFLQHLNTFHWQHFGDLDYHGIKIAEQLSQKLEKQIQLFIPDWWNEYLPTHALTITEADKKKQWPSTTLLSRLIRQHRVIRQLCSSQSWLEQEAIMLDRRLPDALHSFINPKENKGGF
ncbi:Wadjet anti-phage system protein JetD domain-containing protein [Kistimonas asteriae]|uniref:Wadjet anti-phage system protein JetD domain-containing protein n=1 Tax=Kistimonas asteriae TaxID=517724 RepID=UPI001BA57C6E|nr:Wadjet anti-phage system protein JetD domain-containing protein [Kistimonas asteriae]